MIILLPEGMVCFIFAIEWLFIGLINNNKLNRKAVIYFQTYSHKDNLQSPSFLRIMSLQKHAYKPNNVSPYLSCVWQHCQADFSSPDSRLTVEISYAFVEFRIKSLSPPEKRLILAIFCISIMERNIAMVVPEPAHPAMLCFCETVT